MTNILFDVVDVLGGAEPGDSVVVWPPRVGATDDGKVKNTRPETIRVDDGPVTVDLDPGPLWVQLQCGDRADTDPKLVRIPDLDEFDFVVTLRFLLDKVFVYDKVLESWAYENAERAEQAALDAIAARDRSISEADLSQDAAAVSVAAALGFEGHSPEQVIDAATRAEEARDEVVPLADQVTTDAATTAANRAHVDGQVEAIDTAFTESIPPYLQPDAPGGLNATYAVQFSTALDMAMRSLPVGAHVLTHGYRAPGDGGACSYVVVSAATKSYDIAGPSGIAYRPTVTGAIHPKMFGTVNNGETFDNLSLQACYDYAADSSVMLIDGQGLTYTIGPENEYNSPLRGFAHKGAIMRSGRTITNCHFVIHESSTPGTCALSVDLIEGDTAPTYITRCTFNGNRDALLSSGLTFSGREDAGMHLVHLYNRAGAAQSRGEKEFVTVGDVHFSDCHFANAFSYGVSIVEPIDALLRIQNCNFEMQSICVLLHATRIEVDGGSITLGPPRPGMGITPLHSEAELSGNYTGEKRLSLDVRNVRLHANLGTQVALVKIHYSPMQGVVWDSITIENCHGTGSTGIFEAYTGTTSVHSWNALNLEIGSLSIVNCTSGMPNLSYLLAPSNLDSNPIHVDDMYVDKVAPTNRLFFVGSMIDRLRIGEYLLGVATQNIRPFLIQDSYVKDMVIGRVEGNVYANGFLRDFTSTVIDRLAIRGGEVVQHDSHFLECEIKEFQMDGVSFRAVGEGMRRVYFARGESVEVTIRDVLMYSSTNQWVLVGSNSVQDGWVHVRNARHVENLIPKIEVNGLAAARKRIEEIDPLIVNPE